MESNSIKSLAPVQNAPGTRKTTSPIVAAGTAHANRSFVAGGGSIPNRLQFTMDNSSGTVAANYMVFDALGIVASLDGGTYSAPTPSKLTNTIINNYIKAHPLVIDGLRLQATTSEAQFANEITVMTGDIDGRLTLQHFYPQDGVEGDKYNEKIQLYNMMFGISDLTGIKIPVDAGEKLYASFYIKGIFNRQ